jgi:hypothetical protein
VETLVDSISIRLQIRIHQVKMFSHKSKELGRWPVICYFLRRLFCYLHEESRENFSLDQYTKKMSVSTNLKHLLEELES